MGTYDSLYNPLPPPCHASKGNDKLVTEQVIPLLQESYPLSHYKSTLDTPALLSAMFTGTDVKVNQSIIVCLKADTCLKPGTHDAKNHASCLTDGDARTNSNICTCERRLC